MHNTEIIEAFERVCRLLYYFLVETLPNMLNWLTTPLADVIAGNGYLLFLYDLWTALLPDAIVDNFNIIVGQTSITQFLVGGALGLILATSLVRAITRLFVGSF